MQIILQSNAAQVALNTVRVWPGPRFALVSGVWRRLTDIVQVREVPTGWSVSVAGKELQLLCEQPVELVAATTSSVLTAEVFGPTIDAKKLVSGILTFRLVLPPGAKEVADGWELARYGDVSLGLGLGDWKRLGATVAKGIVTLDLRAAKAAALAVNLDPVTVLNPSNTKTAANQAGSMVWDTVHDGNYGEAYGPDRLATVAFGNSVDMGYFIYRACVRFLNTPVGVVSARLWLHNNRAESFPASDVTICKGVGFSALTGVDGGAIKDFLAVRTSYEFDADKGELVDGSAIKGADWWYYDLKALQLTEGGTTDLGLANKSMDVDDVPPNDPAGALLITDFIANGDDAPYLEIVMPQSPEQRRCSIRIGAGI